MDKVIKNTTETSINVNTTGVELLASSQYNLEITEYSLWATQDTIDELADQINNGDIVINDGTDDLTPAEGIALLQYPYV